jgi:hypothetical protein
MKMIRTNRQAFDDYHGFDSSNWARSFEQLVASCGDNLSEFAPAITRLWGARYNLLRLAIDDPASPLADQLGYKEVLAQNRTFDVVEGKFGQGSAWKWLDPEIFQRMENTINDSTSGTLKSLRESHIYGPSLIRLRQLAALSGRSTETDRWRYIGEWASRPTSVTLPDVFPSEQLTACIAQSLVWEETELLRFPWSTTVNGTSWRIRLGDFPEEPMYGLLIEKTHIGNFHEWPQTWTRIGKAKSRPRAKSSK